MKNKILSIITKNEELRSKLADRAKTTENVEELRNLNTQISDINGVIEELRIILKTEEEREKQQSQLDLNILSSQSKEARKDNIKAELRAIAKFAMRKELSEEERSLVTIADNAAIMPQEFINQLMILKKGFPALKPYCHVIPVTSNTGKMPVAILGQNKLVKLTSGQAIAEGAKSTTSISYSVEDYGKIIPIENSLTEDEVVGMIENIITPDFAEGAVATENEEILNIISGVTVTPITAVDHVDLEVAIDKTIPAAKAGLVTITNLSGYCYLKSRRDKEGRSLNLITSVNGVDYFNGKPIITLDDEDIVSAGKYLFYVANLRELVKFFDRKTIEIATSSEVLFDYNQTAVRALERFDTKKGSDRSVKKVEIAIV